MKKNNKIKNKKELIGPVGRLEQHIRTNWPATVAGQLGFGLARYISRPSPVSLAGPDSSEAFGDRTAAEASVIDLWSLIEYGDELLLIFVHVWTRPIAIGFETIT